MKRGEVLECVVVDIDEKNYIWVQYGSHRGLVAPQDLDWNSNTISPSVGTRVQVMYLFSTNDDGALGFSFVGSIKEAYPQKHPINFIDDSIIGERFTSRGLAIGPWIAVKHPNGLFGLLRRHECTKQIGPDNEVEVEIIGIDWDHSRLLVRPVGGDEADNPAEGFE